MTNKYAIYCDSLEDEQLLKDWIKKESDLEGYNNYNYRKLYFHFPANGYSGFRQDVHIFDSCLPEYNKINIKDFLKEYYMKELPKQWVVWNDGSQLFKDTVVHYLNTHYSAEFKGWVKDSWYGVIANQKYQADILVSNPVKITIQEFIKLTTKNMKTELLGLPVIRGEKHHLEAFVKDCEKLGYKTHKSRQTSNTRIQLNGLTEEVVLRNEDAFKILYFGEEEYSKLETLSIKEFQLPSDWSKCLDFMKENMDRWLKIQEENKEPEFKVGDYVLMTNLIMGCTGVEGRIGLVINNDCRASSGLCVTDKIQLKVQVDGQTWAVAGKFTKVTAEDFYKDNIKVFKMTSSSGDFELDVSRKGIYYRPEDKWLHTAFLWEFTYKGCKLPHQSGEYSVDVTKVDVGCKKDCLVSQFQEVYDYYKSITQ